MNNDIQNLVNELNSTTPKTQMYMIQLCRSAINNLYDLTDTIEENISSIQTSVVANTSAISGLQGTIDLINTNLNVYLSRIEALETKTTYISKTENNSTRIENSLIVQNDIDADGLYITGDITAEGEIVGRILESNNDNGRGRFYIDSDGDMALSLPPNAGKLITTGNISEYASDTKLYEHHISFVCALERGGVYVWGGIKIINKSNTLMTINDLYTYLMSFNDYTTRYYPIIGIAINNNANPPSAFKGTRLYNLYPVSASRIDCYDSTGTFANQIGSFGDIIKEI